MAIYVAKSKSEKSFQNTPLSQNLSRRGGGMSNFSVF